MFRHIFKPRRIYLDYASLTPIDKRVLATMKKYSHNDYANPSSWYKEGVAAKKVLESARTSVAKSINAHADEMVFTGGGTESNNVAILGTIEAQRSRGLEYKDMHVVASVIEHSSVLECFDHLKKKGVQVDMVPVDENGIVKLDELKNVIKPSTVLVSIMMVNNEIGSIQPIREIAKIVRKARSAKMTSPRMNSNEALLPLFHTDASQAFLYNEINLENLGVDLLTLDGSKVYGPRGIGALYIRRDIPIEPVFFGGGQEKGIRSGTENIPAIAGFAKAIELANSQRVSETVRIQKLREQFIKGLKEVEEDINVNGRIMEKEERRMKKGERRMKNEEVQSPHILNVSIPKIDNEFFILQLDAKGIACSTKSSCLRDEDESYVLRAIGANSKDSIRFSFGRNTSSKDIVRVLKTVANTLEVRS